MCECLRLLTFKWPPAVIWLKKEVRLHQSLRENDPTYLSNTSVNMRSISLIQHMFGLWYIEAWDPPIYEQMQHD